MKLKAIGVATIAALALCLKPPDHTLRDEEVDRGWRPLSGIARRVPLRSGSEFPEDF
jgi:hypothetical protein